MDFIPEVNDRIAKLIELEKLNPKSFAARIGVSPTVIYNIIDRRRSKPSFEVLEKILVSFDTVRAEWLLMGTGEPFKNISNDNLYDNLNDNLSPVRQNEKYILGNEPGTYAVEHQGNSENFPVKEKIIVATQDTSHNITIPLVNQKAAANYLAGYQSQEYFEHLEALILPRIMIKSGQHLAVRISGDSMEMRFKDKDIVVCRKIERGDWSRIPDNDVCVVVSTTHGIQFKRVKIRLKQHGFIRCKSDNRKHPPFNIEEEELLELWRFQWHLSPDASNLNEDLFNKVDALEDDLHDMRHLVEETKAVVDKQSRVIQNLLKDQNN